MAEKTYMDLRRIRYKDEEAHSKLDGCIARQATRSRADVVKRINRKGKDTHKYIISKKAAPGTKAMKTNNEAAVVVVRTYNWNYVPSAERDQDRVRRTRKGLLSLAKSRVECRVQERSKVVDRMEGRVLKRNPQVTHQGEVGALNRNPQVTQNPQVTHQRTRGGKTVTFPKRREDTTAAILNRQRTRPMMMTMTKEKCGERRNVEKGEMGIPPDIKSLMSKSLIEVRRER